jgi:prepilin-type N-terminal cleavage/methylation domain-containing protein
MTSQIHNRRVRRDGFTLIELLVVIAVIGVLAALIAAGIMSWIEGQSRRNTETAIRSIHATLLRHWDVVSNEAKKEGQQMGRTGSALNDWVKVRLAEAFPVSFEEIEKAYTIAPTNQIVAASRPKRYMGSYQTALLSRNKGPDYVSWVTNNPLKSTESSACLLMSLSLNREGVSNSPDSFQPFTRDVDSDKIPEFVDGWNEPLYFYRFPLLTDSSEYSTSVPLPMKTGASAIYPPVLISSGPNRILGIDPPKLGSVQSFKATNQPKADDNIYNFKLK